MPIALNPKLLAAAEVQRPPSSICESGKSVINGNARLIAAPYPEPEVPYISTLIGATIRLQSVHFPGEFVSIADTPKDPHRLWVLTYTDGRPPTERSDWLVEAVPGSDTQIRLRSYFGSYLYVSGGNQKLPLVWKGKPNGEVNEKARFEVEVGKNIYYA